MDYALAKQLKDAGFPQNLDDNGRSGRQAYSAERKVIEFDDGFWRNADPEIYIPTLEELIEACGKHILSLNLDPDAKLDDKPWWYAKRNKKVTHCPTCHLDSHRGLPDLTNGSNPTEAVARLWLALNMYEINKRQD